MNFQLNIRRDAKSISLLALFSSMVLALEALPIVGLTDIKIPGLNFTLDWTGIPIFIVFLAFGFVYSFITIAIMWVSIAYRNIPGSVFKTLAESFRILGVAFAWAILRNKQVSYIRRIIVYSIFSALFCAAGMYVSNIVLLPFFYGIPLEIAIYSSAVYIPWNILQAVINVIGGAILYQFIPEDLRASAGFKQYDESKSETLSSNSE